MSRKKKNPPPPPAYTRRCCMCGRMWYVSKLCSRPADRYVCPGCEGRERRRRLKRMIYGVLVLLAFCLVLGTAGAREAGSISALQFALQAAVGLAAMAGGARAWAKMERGERRANQRAGRGTGAKRGKNGQEQALQGLPKATPAVSRAVRQL